MPAAARSRPSASGLAAGCTSSTPRRRTPGPTSHPLDESITPDGRYLDVLTDGLHSITSYRIGHHGSLSLVGATGGLPAGDVSVASS